MARSFYEDDEVVVTKPGYNSEIPEPLKEQELSHGDISFVKGMSIRSAPILEEYTKKWRLWYHEQYSIVKAEVDTQVSAVKNEYRTVSQEVNSLIKDPVLPGLIYVLTATLSGSILVNKRSLPLRFLAPTTFGIVSFKYFLPNTYIETKAQAENYEATKFPELYSQQTKVIGDLKAQKEQINSSINHFDQTLASWIHDIRRSLNDLFK